MYQALVKKSINRLQASTFVNNENMGLRKRTSCLSFPSISSNLVCVAEANVLIPTHSRIKDAIDKCLSYYYKK